MKRFPLFLLAIALAAPAFVLADSQSYATPGTYTFTIPAYTSLSVDVRGAGGGGGGFGYAIAAPSHPATNGESGGNSSFAGISASGGGGGSLMQNILVDSDSDTPPFTGGSDGAAGGASGGDSNYTGGGAAGGAGACGWAGTFLADNCAHKGGDGGSGGRATKTYAQGYFTPGQTITVTVGSGGARGFSSDDYVGGSGADDASPGAGGSVTFTWTPAPANSPAPSCSITFDQNPLTGDSTTMHWTSQNATLFYINNVGYVAASGSAKVWSAGDYSGSVSGAGGNATCAATLASSGGNGTLCPDGTPAPSGDLSQCSGGPGGPGGPPGGPGNPSSNPNGNPENCSSNEYYDSQTHSCVACSGTVVNGECVVNKCPNPGLFCDTNGNLSERHQDTTCSVTLVQTCSDGCQDNACNIPPPPQITAWSVTPILVKSGETVTVKWDAEHVAACTVHGTNGDGTGHNSTGLWDMTTSLGNGETSSGITGQTIYTLSCTGEDGSATTTSTTVNVVPSFVEH